MCDMHTYRKYRFAILSFNMSSFASIWMTELLENVTIYMRVSVRFGFLQRVVGKQKWYEIIFTHQHTHIYTCVCVAACAYVNIHT